jgi:hypothetical protein
MNRMFPVAFVLAVFTASSDSDAAFVDLRTLPPEVQQVTAYLTTSVVAPEHREALGQVIRFAAPSLSHKPYLGDQLPVAVAGTNLYRLDLAGLGWQSTWADVIRQHYVPRYRPDLAHAGHVPLVVSGAWFVSQLTDSNETGDAQYQLLYSGKPPKTSAEFRKFWSVNGDSSLAFGRIEDQSGVARAKRRLMENQPVANRAYFWQTFDSEVIAGQTDPLETLTVRPPKHDASELIAGIPKHYLGESGTLQAYFLADAKGNRQEKAPAAIVTDDTGIRGVEIRNTLSCVSCHVEGLRHPTLDAYREYILSGARIYAKDKGTQQEIDRYLDSPIAKEIERNNADYAAGVEMCNGLGPRDNALMYRFVVQEFDADLVLDQQARELYTDAETWRLALGNYSRTHQLTAALAQAAQNKPITRRQWEANFHLAQKALYEWERSK